MNRSRWLVLAALGLLLVVLSNTHFSIFHGGFRLFGMNPLLTAILLAVVIWLLLDRCGAADSAPVAEPAEPAESAEPAASASPAASDEAAEHENGEDADKTA